MKDRINELINSALDAQKLSYSPYSKFKVGAAVLLKDGTILQGANIENAAYGLTMCGERNAVFRAYCTGYTKKDIVALAISSGCTPPASPCGSCRQVLAELIPFDAPIYLVNTQGEQIITNVKELLPLAFTEESL
ncbi:MAG: cytidine deaminase [Bacilli bacterium]|nr:cytidine deaminase [Bacilli bacterium]